MPCVYNWRRLSRIMYGEWLSLVGNEPSSERLSVLERLPLDSARDVVVPVARHIVSTLGISQPPIPSPFTTDPEVEWCLQVRIIPCSTLHLEPGPFYLVQFCCVWLLQVVCYGLSLQLSEHDVIKDCVNIYCEWLSCLSPTPKMSVPKPIIERPNFFARKMINHLYHLFIPRKGEGKTPPHPVAAMMRWWWFWMLLCCNCYNFKLFYYAALFQVWPFLYQETLGKP